MGSRNILCCCGAPPVTPPPSPNNNDVIHLLMIGNGEVGKTTIIKQMKNLVYTRSGRFRMFDDEWKEVRPFTDDDRRSYKLLVHQNILRIIGTLILKVQEFNYNYDSTENRNAAGNLLEQIGEVDTINHRNVVLNSEMARSIERLWADNGIKRAYDRRCQYLISDSTSYFLEHEKLIDASRPDYIPTADDIVRTRDPTRGGHDYNFKIADNRFSFRDLVKPSY